MYFETFNELFLWIDYIMKKDNLYFLIQINSLFDKFGYFINQSFLYPNFLDSIFLFLVNKFYCDLYFLLILFIIFIFKEHKGNFFNKMFQNSKL